MYSSVRNGFPGFTQPLEGRVSWMYLDVKGLVTIGVGNLIDPQSAAVGLPFVHKTDGSAASIAEIAAEWTALKGNQALATKGYRACDPLTKLRLTDEAIDALVLGRLDQNEAFLKKTFTAWDQWPADAQLGVLSMAWAMGPGFPVDWPTFTAACKAQDWSTAAANCHISEIGNAGVKPRNVADVLLFNNAAVVAGSGQDASNLVYPGMAQDALPPPPEETAPSLGDDAN
jgi:GH24 family phage-related lysozyme (muramidase)